MGVNAGVSHWLVSGSLLAAVATGCSGGDEAPDTTAAVPTAPDTDVYVATLEGQGTELAIGEWRNVTDRPGYDNQPAFTPDGSALLYTAADEAGRTDIMRYDLAAERAALLTETYPESEYSATPLPDGTGISVIRVEADSTQRLWRFDWDGEKASVILPDVAPAGYHAWSGETLVLFVLGDPPTLQVAEPGPGVGEVVDEGVGRSLQPIPGGLRISYVSMSDSGGRIMSLDPATGESTPVAPVLGDGQDHAWTPDGTLLMASGGAVNRWDDEAGEWVAVPMEQAFGGEISRMAVSPDGRRLAFVGAR